MIRIQNATRYDVLTGTKSVVSIEIDSGIITRVSDTPFEASDVPTIDAKGMILTQGFCDVHVHFRDPGFTHKEDIYTGAAASLAGGYTDVVMMANTKPAIDNLETLKYVLEKGKETKLNIHSCATVTKDLKGLELTDMKLLYDNGAIGFTDDGIPLMDETLLEKALIKAKELDVPISLHEEDKTLISENGINRGKASMHFGIGGSPSTAESSLIERDVELAIKTGAKLNIQHISTKAGVMAVKAAREKCDNVYAEVTPHHIALTEDATIEFGANAKMNPPLRTEEDRQAILKGIKDGVITMIATDHAPHTSEEKSGEITKTPSGIIGIETAFSIAYEELVLKYGMELMDVLKLLSLNPRRLYKLPVNELKEGSKAEFVLIDLAEEWVFENPVSKSCNSPFIGKAMKGKVKYTFCKGDIAYENV